MVTGQGCWDQACLLCALVVGVLFCSFSHLNRQRAAGGARGGDHPGAPDLSFDTLCPLAHKRIA